MAISFNDAITRLSQQKQAVSGRQPSRNSAAGVAEGVASGAQSRLANKQQLSLQQQALSTDIERLAQQKSLSDTQIQMAHNANLQEIKARRNQTASTAGSTAAGIAAAKYLGAAKVGTSATIGTSFTGGATVTGGGTGGSVAISTVNTGGSVTAGGSGAGISGVGAGYGTGVGVATFLAALSAIPQSIAASRQSHARRALNQQIDAAGGMTDNPEQNRLYATRRAQEQFMADHGFQHTDSYGSLESMYPQLFNPGNNYKIDVAPIDTGYAPKTEAERQAAERKKAAQRWAESVGGVNWQDYISFYPG